MGSQFTGVLQCAKNKVALLFPVTWMFWLWDIAKKELATGADSRRHSQLLQTHLAQERCTEHPISTKAGWKVTT